MSEIGVPWAIYDSAGRLIFLTMARDENGAWSGYTGWDINADFEQKKSAGFKAKRVSVKPLFAD